MKDRLWKIIGFTAIGLILFLSTLIIIRWAVDFATWSTMDSGWAQAVGSIAALAASFGFFYAQKRAELVRAEAESVLTQTKAVIAVLSLCRRTIIAMETALDQMECRYSPGVIPFSPDYFDELRAVFCQFIDPTANFMALQTALVFNDFLMEAKHDFAAANEESLYPYILKRSHERLKEAEHLADILSGHQGELLDACSKYGLNPIAGPLKAPPIADHEDH
jgi:hypothetical protein